MAIENRFASESYVSEVLENYTKIDDLNDYAKLDNLNDYAKLNDLNDYSKLSDLNDYAKLDALNNYATTEYVDSEVERVLSLTERVKSWGSVQYYVRTGQAPYIFNIGDQLTCHSEQFGDLVWDIIGFDQDIPSDNQYTHSMTLQLHNVLDMNIRDYDSQEYAYYVTSDLTPGTYYFYYNAKLDYSANNSYLKFTIEDGVTVPAGAFLYGESTSSVKFISKDETEIYWSGKLSMAGASTIPEDAIILGEINYYSGLSSGGNQYYKNADIRCFLNGEDSTLSNWAPTNELDRAPEYLNDPGFLYQIDSDFRDVLGSVKKRVFHLETNEVEEIDDLIFLPTSSELYGAYIVNRQGEEVNLGDPYEYYVLNSSTGSMGTTGDTARIKYNSENTATAYYLRDPQIGTGTAATNAALKNRTRAVLTSGSITAGSCNITGSGQARYLAPCCCIV